MELSGEAKNDHALPFFCSCFERLEFAESGGLLFIHHTLIIVSKLIHDKR